MLTAKDTAQAVEMRAVLVRVLHALCRAPANRPLILDAGALEPVLETLTKDAPPAKGVALEVLAALAKEDDPRLNSLSSPALLAVLNMLQSSGHTVERKESTAEAGSEAEAPGIPMTVDRTQVFSAQLESAGGPASSEIGIISNDESLRVTAAAALKRLARTLPNR